MSTNCSESLFLIHVSLFTIENGYLAIYGIVSYHSWFPLSLRWMVGPYVSCCTLAEWRKKRREGIETNRSFWMATSGPHVLVQPRGKPADREKLHAVALDKLLL